MFRTRHSHARRLPPQRTRAAPSADLVATVHIEVAASGERLPSGQCTCEPRHWYRHDSLESTRPVTCRSCGNHWWQDEAGREVQGPAFRPYTATLAVFDPHAALIEAYSRARCLSHPPRVERFAWWKKSQLNPLLDGALDYELIARAETAHWSDVYRLRFEQGDTRAIFEYIADAATAFDTPWVVAVRESLGRECSPASIATLRQLRKARTHKRRKVGKPLGVAWDRIRRDVAAFSRMWQFDSEKIEARIDFARKAFPALRRSDGYRIWNAYKPFIDWCSEKSGGQDRALDFLGALVALRPRR